MVDSVALLDQPLVVETSRLRLREFTGDDWPAVFEYHSQPGFLRYYPAERAEDVDLREFVERFIGWQLERPRYRFQLAVTLRATGALIGNAGIRLDEPGARVAELGYEIAPTHWGQGFATEAASAMLEFGFRFLDLRRVRSHCIAENGGSARVLKKVGFRSEGRLRAAEEFKGRTWDVLLFGILAEDERPRPEVFETRPENG